jgi:hypothetical protein
MGVLSSPRGVGSVGVGCLPAKPDTSLAAFPTNHPFRHFWTNDPFCEGLFTLLQDCSSNLKKITVSPAPGIYWLSLSDQLQRAMAVRGEGSTLQQLCEQRGLVLELQDIRVSDLNGANVRSMCPLRPTFPLKMTPRQVTEIQESWEEHDEYDGLVELVNGSD